MHLLCSKQATFYVHASWCLDDKKGGYTRQACLIYLRISSAYLQVLGEPSATWIPGFCRRKTKAPRGQPRDRVPHSDPSALSQFHWHHAQSHPTLLSCGPCKMQEFLSRYCGVSVVSPQERAWLRRLRPMFIYIYTMIWLYKGPLTAIHAGVQAALQKINDLLRERLPR